MLCAANTSEFLLSSACSTCRCKSEVNKAAILISQKARHDIGVDQEAAKATKKQEEVFTAELTEVESAIITTELTEASQAEHEAKKFIEEAEEEPEYQDKALNAEEEILNRY